MFKTLGRHVSYANVAATLALVLSMSGGAMAAKHYLINSTKQINPKVLKKLKGKRGATGATGPAGTQGPPGTTGPAGATGPSTAFNTNSGAGVLGFPHTSGAELTVSTLSLPAGNFSVVGKLIADNDENGPGLMRCELILGGTAIDPGFDGVELGDHPADRHFIVLSGTGSLGSPGIAKIICRFTLQNPGWVEGRYVDRSITAIQVGSLG